MIRAFKVKIRAFEVMICAFEVKICAFEVKIRVFEVKKINLAMQIHQVMITSRLTRIHLQMKL